MDLVLQAFEDLRITENHIRRLHQVLLKHSTKDERHRGDYKALPNHVVAFDENGDELDFASLKGKYTVLNFGCLT